MIRSAFVVAALLFAAASAHAQSFGEDPTLIIRPNSSPDLNLPRVNASVRLSCVTPQGFGGLVCDIVEEAPLGLGFGAAATRVAARLRSIPRRDDGSLALTLRVNFCFDRVRGCAEDVAFGETPVQLEDAVLANIVEGPRLGDLTRHFPRAAWRAGVEGSVNMQCRVTRDAR
jgi:hypothetical protein